MTPLFFPGKRFINNKENNARTKESKKNNCHKQDWSFCNHKHINYGGHEARRKEALKNALRAQRAS